MKKILLPSLALLMALPNAAHAASAAFFGPIVSEACRCPDRAPTYGCVLDTGQRMINFGITIGLVAFTFALAYAGFVWMTSGGNPEARSKGRDMLINVFVGLFILLTAWLVVDFVMKQLYSGDNGSKDFGPWNSILADPSGLMCIEETKPSQIQGTGIGGVIGRGIVVEMGGTGNQVKQPPVSGTTGCPSCISLSAKGISCKSSASCTLDANVVPRVVALQKSFPGSWTVTEAYPPTAKHTNPCHSNGTCIDAGFRGTTYYNAETIVAFASAAKNAGLRPVFETFDCSLRNAARSAGVQAYCRSDSGYGHITGSHFSLYSN